MAEGRCRWALGALALALLAPAACSDDGPGADEARLEVRGEAVVERAGGDRDVVTGRTDVGPGDRVEIVEGTATMALRGGTRFELRAGEDDEGSSIVRMDDVPELEGGDLLVTTPERASLVAAGTAVEVTEGAAKLSRALGIAAMAYDAEVAIDSAGQRRAVPALRSVLVPALGSPQPLRPIAYDANDAWDRRFLGDAIELGRRLESVAGSYTSSLRPGEGRTPGFFRLVLPGLDDEADFTGELIDLDRPPGETLVGAAITELGRRGDFDDRWSAVFGFRDEGAEWGLVALDQDVSREPLLGSVTEAISASPLAFAPPSATASADGGGPSAGPTTPTTAGTDPPPSSGSTTAPPPPETTSPPTTSPPPAVPEDPVTPVLEPVVEPAIDLVGDLLGGATGLLGPG